MGEYLKKKGRCKQGDPRLRTHTHTRAHAPTHTHILWLLTSTETFLLYLWLWFAEHSLFHISFFEVPLDPAGHFADSISMLLFFLSFLKSLKNTPL